MRKSISRFHLILYKLLIISCLPIFLFAQEKKFHLFLYGFEEGLTHRNVYKIQQDTNGFIWIATISGLNQYDGHQFFHYTTTSATHRIPHDYISDLLIDDDNKIWMASGNSLAVLQPNDNSIKLIQLDEESKTYDKPKRLYNLFKNKEGTIFTSTYLENTGESWFQFYQDNELQDAFQAEGNYAHHPIEEFNGLLYFGVNDNQLKGFKFEGNRTDFRENFDLKVFKYFNSLPSFSRVVQMQCFEKEGVANRLYVLLNNGQIYFIDEGTDEFHQHPITEYIFNTGETTSFLVEDNGDIWVGGLSTLWHYQESTKQVANFNKDLREIFDHEATFRQIFKDRTGVIWVATDFGALKISQSDNLFSNYLNEGNEYCNNGFCSIRGITEDDEGNIYFRYYNSIHVLNPKTGRIRPLFNRNKSLEIPFGLVHYNNKLYTGSGLEIDLETKKIDQIYENLEESEGVVMVGKDGLIWFGINNDLLVLDTQLPKNDELRLQRFEDPGGVIDTADFKQITFLAPSQFGNYFWMGTAQNGLYKVSPTQGALAHYSTKGEPTHALSHDRVIGIAEDKGQNLWVGTAEGLNKIDLLTKEVLVLNEEEGMPNHFVNGLLLEGDSVVWASTDNGLARLSISDMTFTSFGEKDGLSDNEFNRISAFKSRNGRMYFGGLNGVNAFYPSKQFLKKSSQQKEAKLVFTAFSKYDGNTENLVLKQGVLDQSDTISLHHTDEFFIFRFALADFANPGSRKYSYKLEGYENEWSEPTNQNIARYNNIPAGNYIFKVRAAVGNGDWLTEELSVNLNIKEAFYRQPWFLISVSLIALGVVFGISKFRIYRLKMHEKELEDLVAIRTSELEIEKQKSDELLLNILPVDIAEELKTHGKAKAQRHESVTVFFSDFKNFTSIASKMDPEDLVAEVDFCFRAYDEITEKYGLEKIKTIGDAYMCVSGFVTSEKEAAQKMIEAALEIQSFLKAIAMERKERNLPHFEARIGIHTGAVVAGIVGIKKFAYDIWGDTVNIASRMEENSEVGRVNISESTYQLVKDKFEFTSRGKIEAKNRGEIEMYFVERILPTS